MVFALVMMGGSGVRFGSEIPKQYIRIGKKPIFMYLVEKLNELDFVDIIVIVSHGDWISDVKTWCSEGNVGKMRTVAAGGGTRSESVKNGLDAIAPLSLSDDDIVLIHDVTHPYVDVEGTKQIIEAVKKHGAASLGARQWDTCYRIDEAGMVSAVIPRQEVVSAGSPEAFFFKNIHKIYTDSAKEELDNMTCAGALALSRGFKMQLIPANVVNLKITFPEDLKLFTLLAKTYFFPDAEQ